jgi:hypothetical protein
MFYMPVTKARVKLVLEAEVNLDSNSELTEEEQLSELLKKLADNPFQFNRLDTTQTVHGEILQNK